MDLWNFVKKQFLGDFESSQNFVRNFKVNLKFRQKFQIKILKKIWNTFRVLRNNLYKSFNFEEIFKFWKKFFKYWKKSFSMKIFKFWKKRFSMKIFKFWKKRFSMKIFKFWKKVFQWKFSNFYIMKIFYENFIIPQTIMWPHGGACGKI